MNTENSFRRLLTSLTEQNEIRVSYNNLSDESEDEEYAENIVHDINDNESNDSLRNSSDDDDATVETDDDDDDDDNINDNKNMLKKFCEVEIKKLYRLRERLETYCSQVPVLGFNSSKYDINLVKSKLFKHLGVANKSTKSFTIKRQNSYLVI